MPGERVLVIDHSAAVQEVCKSVLEEHGYRITIASNGLAALVHPEIEDYDLIIVDSELEGLSGLETTRQIKTDRETYKIPVLLLIPENSLELFESISLKGATGWLAKPFSPKKLAVKVMEVLEEQRLVLLSEEYLRDSAERHMQDLAEKKIHGAVERKSQIIVERAIQSIVSIIDQRARREVESRVSALTAEKEQELVKLTVQEVARSMVEKLAERKVSEAMDKILVDQTEKTVKRAVDAMLPGLMRERLREQIETILPREVETRVNKAAEERAAEVGEELVQIIQQQSQKLVPIIAKETLPGLAERHVETVAETKLPKMVQDSARAAISQELANNIRPIVDAEAKRLRRQSLNVTIGSAIAIVVVGVVVFFSALFGAQQGVSAIEKQASERLSPPPAQISEANAPTRSDSEQVRQ